MVDFRAKINAARAMYDSPVAKECPKAKEPEPSVAPAGPDDKHPILPSLTNREVDEAMFRGAQAAMAAMSSVVEPEVEALKPTAPKLPPMSAEQQAAFDYILTQPGHVFLTGQAGTGKSFVIKHLLETGRCKVTATTARAALLVNGCTVDKLFCFRRDTWELGSYKKLDENMDACPGIIIVDEASMIGVNMARILLKVATTYRKKLVLVGDLAQASPVKDEWITTSPLFMESKFIKLTESHRQGDPVYLGVLNKLRRGEIDDDVRQVFAPRVVTKPPDDDTYIRLFATNKTTDVYNQQRLHALPAANRILSVQAAFIDTRDPIVQRTKPLDDTQREKLINEGPFAHNDQFRVGARVITTKNHPDGLFVNGDMGWLVDIQLADGTSVTELPPYSPFTPEAPLPAVMAFVVKFDRHDIAVAVSKDEQAAQDATSNPSYTLRGFPIRLGWAITVHRAQGMTVDKAFLDMNTITFMQGESKHGLAYVALSRTRELSGLLISNWRDDAVLCVEAVKQYV